MTHSPIAAYVDAVLALYRRLPDVATRPRTADRELARDLYRRGVSIAVVEAALALATTRRRARPAGLTPRSPVRSLHYYLPVIEELRTMTPVDGYLDYLRDHIDQAGTGARPENSVFK